MTFKGAEMINSSKQGITSVTKLFQGLKMLFFSKKDKNAKFFIFWAKIVKFAKVWVLNRKILFWKG